jgi:hypothetical protein
MVLMGWVGFTTVYFHPHCLQSRTRKLTRIQHPHHSPAETWKSLFKPTPDNLDPDEAAELNKVKEAHSLFTPSLKPAHEEMLRILREEDEGMITIVAVGPLYVSPGYKFLKSAATTRSETPFAQSKTLCPISEPFEYLLTSYPQFKDEPCNCCRRGSRDVFEG